MKKIYLKILLVILFVVSFSVNAQINEAQAGEFINKGDFIIDFPCCDDDIEGSPSDLSFGSSFGTSFDLALSNHDLISLAEEADLDAWFHRQKDLMKQEIGDRFNKSYASFDQARNDYFKHWERGNILKNVGGVKNKYNSRVANRRGIEEKCARNLKLLELREGELNLGNVNNTSYGAFNFNGVPIGDITSLSQLNSLRIQEMNAFSQNQISLHNDLGVSDYLSQEITNGMGHYTNTYNFNYGILNAILQQQINYYNNIHNHPSLTWHRTWYQLDLMQMYLNNVRVPIPYITSPVRTADFGTFQFIEDYANNNRQNGVALFDAGYEDYLVQQTLGGETDERAIEAAEYAAELQAEFERQEYLDNLLDGVSLEDLIIDQINQDLDSNPYKLLDIDCNQIQEWQNVAQFQVPGSIKNKIDQINRNTSVPYWDILNLENASGKIVNMDFFPITISQFPINPSTNSPYTPLEFFQYFRNNLTELAQGSDSNVQFTPSTITGFNEAEIWNSNNPIGSIISISILENSGSVVCSGYDINNPSLSADWHFTTLKAPWTSHQDGDGYHPVSGHRQFGYYRDTNNNYVFYVRGVDRFTTRLTEIIADKLSKPDAFEGADNLWDTFQENLANLVNNSGGNATINNDIKWRPNWNKVKDVLLGNKPISDLGCN